MRKYYYEKYEISTVYVSLKEKILKSAEKYKNHWQVGYHRKLKKENFVRTRDLNLEPLDNKANALSIGLFFQTRDPTDPILDADQHKAG